ncbi:hypothetical protein XIS1_1270004 [Xenorhabdus innexi]|uniref:Uncharacterized protein n=1 Tax=Xenorhabdus innexi TaxID=290109 RepID=A0A1N6MSH5_9GAMM|nr:hypothetical protein [Xenorhabdus innexi]SIP71787.1 hypothetical protein XIS1_1270004 [Xenorhabdus innexi]
MDHPAFRNAIRTVAGLYDYKVQHADKMTFRAENGAQSSLYLAYALINPQGDRSKTSGGHEQSIYHTLGTVEKMLKALSSGELKWLLPVQHWQMKYWLVRISR